MELITNQYKFKIIRNKPIDSFDEIQLKLVEFNIFFRLIVFLIAIKDAIESSIMSFIFNPFNRVSLLFNRLYRK